MKTRLFKLIAFLLACLSFSSILISPAAALNWSGDATGAGGNCSGVAQTGFAIVHGADNLAGYRFSVVDKDGKTYNNLVIDVFRDLPEARGAFYLSYANWGHKFTPKYNKVQWIAKQNKGYSTGQSNSNTFLEGADIFFASTMPITTGIERWMKSTTNLNAVLNKLGFSNHRQLVGGDKVLVEPLYFLRINNNWHTMTVTEIGIFGKSAYGGSSTGGNVFEEGYWGWVKKYTNRIYPNSLHETSGADGLWTGATAFSSGYATFQRLINYGYGIGIAFAIDNSKSYTVQYKGNGATSGSTPDSIHEIDVPKRLNANGYAKEHYLFTGWNTKADGSGVSYRNKQSVVNLATKKGEVVKLYAQWKIDPVLSIEAIEPNSAYREGVTVITSFNVINETDDKDYIPSDNVSVKFKVYSGSTLIHSDTKTAVVVPKDDKNLIYFKWTVPNRLESANIKISGEVYLGNLKIDQDAIMATGGSVANYQTPDTAYEASKPSDWRETSIPSKSLGTASWSQWVYEGGRFVKKSYKIALSSQSFATTPDTSSPSAGGSSLKSGYGFSLTWKPGVTSKGSSRATSAMYTLPQTAYALFPEFRYSSTSGKCRLLDSSGSSFYFKKNDDAEGDRLHFIPLWYPDKNYVVGVYAYDCWTPAGMISIKDTGNTLSVSGDLYDDYFIGRK